MLVKMRLLRLIESCTASSRIEDSFLPRLEPFGDR